MKTLTLLAERLGKPVSYFLDDHARDFTGLQTSAQCLHQARQAMNAGKVQYARQLLEEVTAPELIREKLLLAANLPGADTVALCCQLPSLDAELLLRAEAALAAKNHVRCRVLLAAAEDQDTAPWNFAMGRLEFACGSWNRACEHLLRCEEEFPAAIALLEICFRELGDYKQAYVYACKQKK